MKRSLCRLLTGLAVAHCVAPAVGQTAEELTPAEWLGEIRSGTKHRKIYAAWAIAQHGAAAVPLLVRALDDEDPLVRAYSLDALRHLGSTARTARARVDAMLEDPEPRVRERAALTSLRLSTAPDEVDRLLAALDSEYWETRFTAAHSIRVLDRSDLGEKALPVGRALVGLLLAADEELDRIEVRQFPGRREMRLCIRFEAVRALAGLGPVDGLTTVRAFAKASDHEEDDVAITALMALRVRPELIDRSVHPVLAATESWSSKRRELALEILAEWAPQLEPHDALVLNAATRVFRDPEPDVRARGFALLQVLGPRAAPAADSLVTLIEESHWNSIPDAARTLATIGDPDGTIAPRLMTALRELGTEEDVHEQVDRARFALQSALGALLPLDTETGIESIDRSIALRFEATLPEAEQVARRCATALRDLTSGDAFVTRDALRTLVQHDHRAAIPAIVELTSAKQDGHIRIDALYALVRLDAVEAAPGLRHLLADESDAIATTAALLLTTFEDAPSRGPTVNLLVKRIEEGMEFACHTAARSGLVEIVPHLERLVLDPAEPLMQRIAAGRALLDFPRAHTASTFSALARQTGARDARPQGELESDEYVALRALAFLGLARTNPAPHEDLLRSHADARDPATRAAVRIALARLGDASCLAELVNDQHYAELLEISLSPSLRKTLESVRYRASELANLRCGEVLDRVAKDLGIRVEVSDQVRNSFRTGPMMLSIHLSGVHLDGLGALRAALGIRFFDDLQEVLVATDDGVRFLHLDECPAHYAAWLKARQAK